MVFESVFHERLYSSEYGLQIQHLQIKPLRAILDKLDVGMQAWQRQPRLT